MAQENEILFFHKTIAEHNEQSNRKQYAQSPYYTNLLISYINNKKLNSSQEATSW